MNKRIIVIDDEESIIGAFHSILSGPRKEISALKSMAAESKARLLGKSAEPKTQGRNYELTGASQGEEGYLKILKAKEKGKPFALAFIDVRMPPGWDGVRTSKEIRKIDPDIEIVIITAYSDMSQKEISDEIGTSEKLLFLRKPFDAEEIKQLALALTRKWDLELKSRKHREYLELMLASVRRLKTLSITSVRGVLSAVLDELLVLIDARKGFIAKLEKDDIGLEIVSESLTPDETSRMLTEISEGLSGIDDITWLDGIMVFPLKNGGKIYYILVSDPSAPVEKDRLKLLKLFMETASEVLDSVARQEQYLKAEKIATIGQVAAGILHEVNNPLTGIVGMVELFGLKNRLVSEFFDSYSGLLEDVEGGLDNILALKLKQLDNRFEPRVNWATIERYMTLIEKAVDQIQGLMKNVRGFTRSADFDLELNDVSEALEDTLELAYNNLKRGITLHREWSSPLMARCDINSLKQVFLNLVLNAVQAMQGVGELWIIGKNRNGKVVISIRDTGPGLSNDEKDRIFEAFYSTKDDGTGLGLSIVKGIMEQHKGSISVESEPGKGTTFQMEIPAI